MNLDFNCANDYLRETVRAINDLDQSKLREIVDQLGKLQDNEGILWVAGNGGSAATGAHLACDLGKGIATAMETPMRTLSLNEQIVTQSAWANDFGFENALMNQLRYLARPQDGLLVISGSGNSVNLVNLARWAQEHGLYVISLLGANGGKISDYTTLELRVSSTDQQVVENLHLVVVHWLFKVMAHAG